MITQKQLDANRQNALASTGPQTPEGLEASRRNALVHGLRAEHLMLEGEDENVFAQLRQQLGAELNPEGLLETDLVDQIASLMWRARRIPQFETALVSWMGAWCNAFAREVDSKAYRYLYDSPAARLHKDLEQNPGRKQPSPDKSLVLGRLLQYSLDRDLMAKLSRYETHLVRQLKLARTELNGLQAARAQKMKTIGQTQATVVDHVPAGAPVGGPP